MEALNERSQSSTSRHQTLSPGAAGAPSVFSCSDSLPTGWHSLACMSDTVSHVHLTRFCPFAAPPPGALRPHPRGPRQARPQPPLPPLSPQRPRRPPPFRLRRRTRPCPHTSCSPTASASWRSLDGRRSGTRGRTSSSGHGSSMTCGSASRTGERGWGGPVQGWPRLPAGWPRIPPPRPRSPLLHEPCSEEAGRVGTSGIA